MTSERERLAKILKRELNHYKDHTYLTIRKVMAEQILKELSRNVG